MVPPLESEHSQHAVLDQGSILAVGSDQAGGRGIVEVERVNERAILLGNRWLLDDIALVEPVVEPIEGSVVGIGRKRGQREILVFGTSALADGVGALEKRLGIGAPCARIQAANVVGVHSGEPEH